jgi:hypothetical protein
MNASLCIVSPAAIAVTSSPRYEIAGYSMNTHIGRSHGRAASNRRRR